MGAYRPETVSPVILREMAGRFGRVEGKVGKASGSGFRFDSSQKRVTDSSVSKFGIDGELAEHGHSVLKKRLLAASLR